MSDPVARSWRITRRALAAALVGGAAGVTWPRWAFWRPDTSALQALATRPDAAALRQLGLRLAATAPWPQDELIATLNASLARGGYDAAIAQDRASGALLAVDGWLVPETQALAGLWLASA